jgi:pimeloyl-ACP methyl ester carboxylesterase
MNINGSKSRVARRIAQVGGGLLGLALAALVYAAYGYQPPEDPGYASPYLAALQAGHHDAYLNAGQFRLHYARFGHGEPVVVLPGGGAWIYDVRGLSASLAASHTVYAVDPPGSGYTTPRAPHPDFDALYTLANIDDALLDFMNQLGLARADFVGNSWGGGYTLAFAQRHPERVRRLVSIDGTGLDLPEKWTWQLAKWPLLGEASIKLTASRDYVRATLERLYGHRVDEETVREYFAPYVRRSNLTAQWVLERNLDWRITERAVPGMRLPMLIVWGAHDDVLDPKLYLPRWRALAPSARIVVIAGAGHTPHTAQPARVNAVVGAFLDPQAVVGARPSGGVRCGPGNRATAAGPSLREPGAGQAEDVRCPPPALDGEAGR